MSLAQSNVLPVLESAPSFALRVRDAIGDHLTGSTLETVQVNVGLKCNLACRHCHVESSPKRNEEMSWETMQAVLLAAKRAGAHTLDITGGAPELHPRLQDFIDAAIGQGLHVMVRTNLTIMLQPGFEEFPHFFADRSVHLVASLPCYLPNNVDKQRGRFVYRDSIAAIQQLNALGYGLDSDKRLDLVYNPGGPSLPPDERDLEEAYREALHTGFGIHFNSLYAIANMPIGRFLHDMERAGTAAEYQQLLHDSFNADTLDALMCRHQLHVGWDGTMYDCDFNFALGIPSTGGRSVRDFHPEEYRHRRIAIAKHCFACTAGCGSSCGGALSQ